MLAALETIYVQAGLVQLLGFVMLLATYIQLRKWQEKDGQVLKLKRTF